MEGREEREEKWVEEREGDERGEEVVEGRAKVGL